MWQFAKFPGFHEIYLVRHGESESNVASRRNEPFRKKDAKLTPRGQQQAVRVGRVFFRRREPSVVLASPMRRTIETALLAFPAAEIHLASFVREFAQFAPSVSYRKAKTKSYIKRFYPKDYHRVQWHELEDSWGDNQGPLRTIDDVVRFNAKFLNMTNYKTLIKWVKQQPKGSRIAVVTHGTFTKYLTGESLKNTEVVNVAKRPPRVVYSV